MQSVFRTRPFVGTIGLLRQDYFPEGNPGTCPVSTLYVQVGGVAAVHVPRQSGRQIAAWPTNAYA